MQDAELRDRAVPAERGQFPAGLGAAKIKASLGKKRFRDKTGREGPRQAGAVSPRAGRRTDKLLEKTGKKPTRSAEVTVSFADLY